VEEFVDTDIEARQDEIATSHGYTISAHSLILYGRCERADCPRRKAIAPTRN
jgi:Fur family ferric uptake transcriptional regulator